MLSINKINEIITINDYVRNNNNLRTFIYNFEKLSKYKLFKSQPYHLYTVNKKFIELIFYDLFRCTTEEEFCLIQNRLIMVRDFFNKFSIIYKDTYNDIFKSNNFKCLSKEEQKFLDFLCNTLFITVLGLNNELISYKICFTTKQKPLYFNNINLIELERIIRLKYKDEYFLNCSNELNFKLNGLELKDMKVYSGK